MNFKANQLSLLMNMFQRPMKSSEGICNLCLDNCLELKSHISGHFKEIAQFILSSANGAVVKEIKFGAAALKLVKLSPQSEQSLPVEFPGLRNEELNTGFAVGTKIKPSHPDKIHKNVESVVDPTSTYVFSLYPPRKLETKETPHQAPTFEKSPFSQVATAIDLRLQDTLQWLSAPDPYSDYRAGCTKRHIGTGTWLIGNSQYRYWKESPNRVLWINGRRKF